MNNEAARDIVQEALGDIAPEADLATVDPTAPLHEVLDLDSMDFLNFVTNLHERTRIDIPERDYQLVATIDGCVTYLTTHSAPEVDEVPATRSA